MKKRTIFLSALMIFLVGCGERQGEVKWSDCREKIFVSEDSIESLTKRFTCSYWKTNGGKLLGGQCVNIETEENGSCRKAYIYNKSADKVCNDPKYPRLHVDDLCYP
jgi:hypothetical protein